MTKVAACLLAILCLMCQRASVLAGELSGPVFRATGTDRGLFIVIADNTELAKELAQAGPLVVFIVAPTEKVDALRVELAAANLHGRVTVGSVRGGRLPLIDNLAAVVIDPGGKIDTTEAMRVVRPLGYLYAKKTATQKPWTKGAGNWPQYHYNAAMTDRSNDLVAGPAEGIQWLAGDNSIQPAKMGVRVVGARIVQVEERGVVVRDAFSGLPIWRRADIKPSNRYTFLADEKRVYLIPRVNSRKPVYPSHMTAIDLKTGEHVLEYDQGVKLGWAVIGHSFEENRKLEKTDRDKAKRNAERAKKSYEAVQARLADGVLLQTIHNKMIALEASTGKKLWEKNLFGAVEVTDRKGKRKAAIQWHHPMILDGRVYAVEGETAPSWSYTHWPMGAVRVIHCLNLKTGKSLWTWNWPEELGRNPAAYNMTPVGRWLGLTLRGNAFAKGSSGVLFVKKDGTAYKHAGVSPYGKDIGGGHSHTRMMYVGDKVWIHHTTKPQGTIDLSDPGDKVKWGNEFSKLPRPVGCTVMRATPKYIFGSLTTYAVADNKIRHTNAARSVCDVGAIPAAGMTFITPTQCFCAPYLPGFKAFHPRPFEGVQKIERLDKGPAAPATGSDGPADWPMYMANPRRGNWTSAVLPKTLKQLWTINPAPEDAKHPIVREWRDNWYTQGPITSVSISEGAAVFALIDRQQVVSIDLVGGREKWRTTVDGRVDTAPTIRKGVVYVGTRNGWVYALNRDSGKLIWRFFAAPRTEKLMTFGQLESRWPLFGSVLVDDDGVWALAGRHNDTDAGLWWWNLNAVSGKPLASGRLGGDNLPTSVVSVRGRSDKLLSGANSPVISNGKLLFTPGIYLEKKAGKLVAFDIRRREGSGGEHAWWADNFKYDIVVPGNQGLVFDYAQMGGYKMPYYGHTQAPVYAYNGDKFIHAGGTTREQHRGGDRGGRRTEVTRFRKFDSLRDVPHSDPKRAARGVKMKSGNEIVWKASYHESDGRGLGGLAVAGDAVLVGFSVENRDHWRAARAMPHRLRTFDFETGKRRQDDLTLPAKPILHGVTVGSGCVLVVCEDGSIVCFGR
ncbi:MAG: PQQ-binding-like beta-propeller repeat protein [Phycisphaerae bacterium]|jgi:outer membrane protein assembly factor BamB|nr:PQQ-binding-like beta-propeller repeat protein [Phycisphaerae bacterium]